MDDCPVCGAPTPPGSASLLAPFIIERVAPEPRPLHCELRECRECGLRFFRQRYSQLEMNRLYSGYRSAHYLCRRRVYEPWYTARVNAVNDQPSVFHERRRLLGHYVRSYLPLHVSDVTCVDIGGDAGQLIPLSLGARRYVIDVSDRPVHPGVTRLDSLKDLPDQETVLLMISHVLEHIPDPLEFLQD